MSLQLFPDARVKGSYILGPSHRKFHHAEKFAIAAVEYCCYFVHSKLGILAHPLQIWDCSTSEGKTPEGRHPKGSHDGGINLDLSYYGLSKLPNGVPGPHNGHHMTAPPDPTLFATQAEILWFLAMGRLEVDIESMLVRLCATDPFIESYLDPKIQTADEEKKVIGEALRICYSRKGGGWEVMHHHHHHIRFNALKDGDRVAEYIERKWIAPLLQEKPTIVLDTDLTISVPDQPRYPYMEDEFHSLRQVGIENAETHQGINKISADIERLEQKIDQLAKGLPLA